MKLILLLLLTGCAAPMEELMVDAEECVDNTRNVSTQGIVTKPSDEQRGECWLIVNERLETEAQREEKKKRTRLCCVDKWGKQIHGCKCIYDRRAIDRMRY